ncbi:hypothetical protein B0F90DRAFT_1669597 [Multifurca ochricompacta]|uniref:Uncharacterized protein n=1 Tax=Multifurca ochricompacta TaxID=376703 RepID=A0AAD4LZV2_9AGAM|nr:hypothetical protein B0F90DRAFT_1669597 [Multifurca ochricompacta]
MTVVASADLRLALQQNERESKAPMPEMVKPDDGDCGVYVCVKRNAGGLLVHLLLYVYASVLQKEWSGESDYCLKPDDRRPYTSALQLAPLVCEFVVVMSGT